MVPSMPSTSPNDTSPAMTPEQRKAIAVQIGDAKPATDALIGSFAESVANVRNHEHPSWEDLYCMNLTSYMGERMAPVLKRLLGAETEVDQLRARVAELEAVKPAQFQDCQVCGAGYEYGQPCAACDFKKRMAAELAGNPDAFPRDLTPDEARRIERDRPETGTSHDCTLPLSRRLDCGHCPHEVCQDCQRCPHTCRCASPRDLRPGAEAARRMIRDRREATS